MKTIIIGAGCAGLTAAQVLLAAGETDITILEAQGRAGGRMVTYSKNGYHVDMAAQLVHPGYHSAKQLIHDLGMDDELVVSSMDGLRIFDGRNLIIPAPTESMPELGKTLAWMDQMGGPENFGKFAAYVESYCKEKMYEGSVDWFVDELDDKGNFRDFVIENFGEGLLHGFVEPVTAAVGLCYPENIGIWFGLQIMWTVLAGEASLLKRGIGSLADAVISQCGDRIRTNTPVKKVVIENGKATGVITEDGFLAADRIICAVTANHALEILEDAPYEMTDALARVTYCPCIPTLILVDKSKFKFDGIGALFMRKLNAPFGVMSFKAAQSPQSVPEGKDAITCFVYEDGARKLWDKSEKEIADAVIDAMEMAIPGIRDAVEGYCAVRFPEANYLMEAGTSTAIKDFRDNHYKCVDSLYLCGEYMYTGSYESAIAAGRRAAEVALGKLKSI
ncbi:MAG: FAD-dependent oxidoreductase [Lachnospiraceae bacterium]|nr:FAD-dependent oxidoreductase [Lachnospiraceae bacterium]